MDGFRLDIDPDIRRARALPASVYTDQRLFDAARERVFAPAWHLVGDTLDLPPGQVEPLTLLEGCLDEPLLLTHEPGAAVACLSNVCTHRGNLVADRKGSVSRLRCRYHGRRFGLDGKCHGAPELEGSAGFPAASDDLPKVAHQTWGPLRFVSLAPRVAFAELVRELAARCSWLPLDRAERLEARCRDYLVEASWALYVDNYLEGFHIPFVHQGLLDTVDFPTYRTETWEWGTLQTADAAAGEEPLRPPEGHVDHGRPLAAYYVWLFPATMLNFYPWGISVNVVQPLGVARTRVRYLTYAWDRSRLGKGAGGDLERVELEDEAIVEACQRGMRSRLYDRGRYSPTQERGVHHFHRLLARELSRD